MTVQQIQDFQQTIWEHYNANKRSFPWRETKNPYHIHVSEIMLQQTQTNRVVAKYNEFLEQYPTVFDLSHAPIAEVLILWSGLGYNRRAKFLWIAAKEIALRHKGIYPGTEKELEDLPGIGHYTARAIATFAYDRKHTFVETNIRTVIIHFFFKDVEKVSDKEISQTVEQTLPDKNFREWYYALMDYGNYLKSTGVSYFEKQKHYKKQSPFKGSLRYIRGYILKYLSKNKSLNVSDIVLPGYSQEQITSVVDALATEELVSRQKNILRLPTHE
ncbi:MAG: A/G-specific adenine glycosylase [Candidatus Dojkabacteria bacterium]|nr:MAG: A/G-specific adenine glycosylase [Candidatus Dojkabacteria bacterium]